MSKYENIEELLNATEGGHCQFKEWKTKDNATEAAKICCALANHGGGKFVIGISDERPRKVVGTTAFMQPERERERLITKLHVGVEFVLYDYDGKRVLVFEVASRPVGLPVAVDGIAWWYIGDSLVPMPEDIRRSIYAESGYDFSGDICQDATIADLDGKAIEAFRRIWAAYGGNKRIVNLPAEQLLRDCGAITDGGVTNAALILFGTHKALSKYLPRAEVIFEYRSTEVAGPADSRQA